jgi:hypothetical protein
MYIIIIYLKDDSLIETRGQQVYFPISYSDKLVLNYLVI